MRILLIILALLVSSSCNQMERKKDPYFKVEKLFLTYSEKVERTQGIRLTRYGFNWSGRNNVYDGKVHLINLGYNFEREMEYADAKKCFFAFVDDLIAHVNQHEEFKDIFFHFPIGYEDFHLSFSFDYYLIGNLKKNDVRLISIYENRIYYEIVNGFDRSNKYNPYHTRSIIENFDIKNTDTHKKPIGITNGV